MVDLSVYRARIGCFTNKGSSITEKSHETSKNSVLIIFLLIVLLLSNDVESNPGPSHKEILKKAKDLASTLENLSNYKYKKNRVCKTETERKKNKTFKKLSPSELINNASVNFFKKEAIPKHFQSEDLTCVIQRIYFKRQRNFRLSDYHFEVSFHAHEETEEIPTLFFLKVQIHNTLEKIIDEIQDEISLSTHGLIYFCFKDDSFTAELHTGAYDLALPAKDIAQGVFNQLSNILRSFDKIKLSNSFKLYIKVLSTNHIQHNIRQGKPLKFKGPRYLVGKKPKGAKPPNLLANPSQKNIIRFENFPELENKCLLASMIVGYYRIMYYKHCYDGSFKKEALIYKKIMKFREKSGRAGKAALKQLMVEIKKICQLTRIQYDGPHDLHDTLTCFADVFKVQFSIYSNLGNRRIATIPAEKNLGLPQIALLEEKYVNETVGHISLLISVSGFFSKTSHPCIYCDRSVRRIKGHSCRWRGKTSPICFVCQRINLFNPDDYFVHQQNFKDFCIKTEDIPRVKVHCKDCNLDIDTTDCLKVHKCTVRGVKCKKDCGRFIYNKGKKSAEELQESHNCFEDICRSCQASYPKGHEHSCTLKILKKQQFFPNHAFFDIESSIMSGVADCSKCFNLEENYRKIKNQPDLSREKIRKNLTGKLLPFELVRCSEHLEIIWSSGEHFANYLVLYYETSERGTFSKVHFADHAMNHADDLKETTNVLKFNYLPEGVTQKELCTENIGAKKFQKRDSSSYNLKKKLFKNNTANGAAKFLSPSAMSNSDEGDLQMLEGEDAENFVQISSQKKKTKHPPRQGAKRVNIKKDFDLKSFKKAGVVEKMLLFFVRNNLKNYTLLAHNSSKFDMILLCQACYKNGITPSLLVKGMQIIQLIIAPLNLTCLDSLKYLPMSLSKIGSTYNLPVMKGFFCHELNKPEYYNYCGTTPAVEHFLSFNDDERTLQCKKKYVTEKKEENYLWDFKKEIAAYCDNDVLVLTLGCLNYLKQALDFQIILHKVYPVHEPLKLEKMELGTDLLDPFGKPFCGVSGYIYGIYRKFVLPRYKIYTMKDENACNAIRSSKGEQEFVMYYNWKYPEHQMFSNYTSPRNYKFAGCVPDFYIPDIPLLGFYNGCCYHYCGRDNCPYYKTGINKDVDKNFLGKTYTEMETTFNNQLENLVRDYNFKKSQIVVITECEWADIKKGNTSNLRPCLQDESLTIQKFMTQIYQPRPERLIPRDSLRGGRCDAIELLFKKEDRKKSYLRYDDLNSLYPYVTLQEENAFPVGEYKNLIRKEDLKKLLFEENCCYFVQDGKKVHCRGLVQVKIECPNLLIPFLPHRVKSKKAASALKSVCGICRTCCETDQTGICQHNKDQKSFISTYVIDEIAYAVCTLGYKIHEIFEAYVWVEHERIFESFCRILASFKTRNSGFPADVKSLEDKESYVKKINKEMKFNTSDTCLTLENVVDKSDLRCFFKLCSNSVLGKLSQANDKTITIAVTSQKEIDEVFADNEWDIEDFILINSDIVQLSIKRKKMLQKPSRTSQVVLGAHVTAWARMQLDKDMRSVEKNGGTIFYMDTDSIIYSLPNHISTPLPMGESYGQYKSEVGNHDIVCFATLGCKNYCYIIHDKEKNCSEEVTKVRGFFIKAPHNKAKLDYLKFENYIDSFLNGEEKCQTIGQFQIYTDRKDRKLKNEIRGKIFRNSSLDKRVVFKNLDIKCYSTLPFGYSLDMYKKYIIKTV